MNLKVSDAKREDGFTLIELLVVVIIIGILAAIAIPVFLNQRAQAWERTAQSDARNAAIALESYFNDEFEYPDVTGTFESGESYGDAVTLSNGEVITPSPEVTITYRLNTAEDAFLICADHANLNDGTTPEYHSVYVSSEGGISQEADRNAPSDNCTWDGSDPQEFNYNPAT